MEEANDRLLWIIPLSLGLIMMLLYSMFSSVKDCLLVMVNVLEAAMGGVFALYFTGTHFSISGAVGFVSVFGVAVQDGVLLVTYCNQMRARGYSVWETCLRGPELRVRPVVMTSLTAAFGLFPAAVATSIGSQAQKPLAIVVVGAMLCTLFLTRYMMPILYSYFPAPRGAARAGDEPPRRRRPTTPLASCTTSPRKRVPYPTPEHSTTGNGRAVIDSPARNLDRLLSPRLHRGKQNRDRFFEGRVRRGAARRTGTDDSSREVERKGLEPSTSALRTRRFSQLSYRPIHRTIIKVPSRYAERKV